MDLISSRLISLVALYILPSLTSRLALFVQGLQPEQFFCTVYSLKLTNERLDEKCHGNSHDKTGWFSKFNPFLTLNASRCKQHSQICD